MGLLSHMANAHMHLQLCAFYTDDLHTYDLTYFCAGTYCQHIVDTGTVVCWSLRGKWGGPGLLKAHTDTPHPDPRPHQCLPLLLSSTTGMSGHATGLQGLYRQHVVERVPQCCGLYFGFKSCVAACCSGHLLPCNTYISCIIFQREGHRQEGSAAT